MSTLECASIRDFQFTAGIFKRLILSVSNHRRESERMRYQSRTLRWDDECKEATEIGIGNEIWSEKMLWSGWRMSNEGTVVAIDARCGLRRRRKRAQQWQCACFFPEERERECRAMRESPARNRSPGWPVLRFVGMTGYSGSPVSPRKSIMEAQTGENYDKRRSEMAK